MNCKQLLSCADPDLKCVVKSAALCLSTKFRSAFGFQGGYVVVRADLMCDFWEAFC